MAIIHLICSYCKKEFFRDLRHVNENKKLSQKPYCSLSCLGQSQRQRLSITCENSECGKKFERSPGSMSPHNFCSKSCSAKISNAKRTKIIRECANPLCNKDFQGERKYCSISCVPKNKSRYTKEVIIETMRSFVEKYGRIPTKLELGRAYKMARRHFKTWNKAIKAAGFKPNPVMFARKHTANDGHVCDSLAEKIIDDWLYTRKINHKRSIPYPSDLGLNVDFVIKDYWIEFFGLHGVHKRYDELRKIKLQLGKQYGLKLIEIYPQHLFPKNNLDQVLSIIKSNKEIISVQSQTTPDVNIPA